VTKDEKRPGPSWDFGYEPPSSERDGWIGEPGVGDDDGMTTRTHAIVASRTRVDPAVVADALRGLMIDVEAQAVLDEAPLFWTRLRSDVPASPEVIARALAAAAIDVRYVTDACAPSLELPPPLDFTRAATPRPAGWRTRARRSSTPPSSPPSSPPPPGDWFLGRGGGIHIDREVCGTGAGMRLAVIDDETADLDRVELDRLVPIGLDDAPATSGHAALMVGWAMGALRPGGERFDGVAPDASVRVYCIPKPGGDVVSLPTAIARAVFDGADVIVCATYLGMGATSPLLDDALEVAVRLGRRGRGTVVLLPTGREASSTGNSIHASLSLSLDDPASDPRVHCVAPGGREGGWFLFRGPSGKVRPFANRGPAVRWLAPGDDVAYPLATRDQLFHAESSGASAIAAGVVLLVLGANPTLTLPELHAVLARTVDAPCTDAEGLPLADPHDLLPVGHDRDGHNARTGYGRLNASAACATAADPVALALAAIGEPGIAAAWCSQSDRPYSEKTARWIARALLGRPDLDHALRTVVRHVRLLAAKPSRSRAHAPGGLARQLGTLARELLRMRPPSVVARELSQIATLLADPRRLASTALDERAMALFRRDAPGDTGSPSGDARTFGEGFRDGRIERGIERMTHTPVSGLAVQS
jgi:hypothetical protein